MEDGGQYHCLLVDGSWPDCHCQIWSIESVFTKFMMSQNWAHILFVVQSIVAFTIFLFASQREAFPWAGWVTSVGLALWFAIGVPLLIIYKRTLYQRLPWSLLIPLKLFFLFAGIPPSDLYQAGLLMPLSANIGLTLLTMGQALDDIQPNVDGQA
ncbi:hypothetical protein FJTKL_09295 [Diaporthe vaccinii]|uniref:Uncharacterized protein n=2 Tax=Diaporthe vaccinii TaxID=105482 RepID=A0ABR4FCA1_9PEZI